jgi:MoxR-like ATPase
VAIPHWCAGGLPAPGEEAIRYGWNYGKINWHEGPFGKSIVETPVMRAMKDGKIARIEELTRIGADVQDALITILSEKSLPIPELKPK